METAEEQIQSGTGREMVLCLPQAFRQVLCNGKRKTDQRSCDPVKGKGAEEPDHADGIGNTEAMVGTHHE